VLDPKPCEICADMYDQAGIEDILARHGWHHYHCGSCSEVTGQMGHYGKQGDGPFAPWGFSCEQIKKPVE
jgi:hypothetical protein